MKGGGRPKRLLPHAKMLLVPIRIFPLLGSLCSGSTFLLGRLFHTERSLHTYQFTVVFVSGPLMQEHFSSPLLKRRALYYG